MIDDDYQFGEELASEIRAYTSHTTKQKYALDLVVAAPFLAIFIILLYFFVNSSGLPNESIISSLLLLGIELSGGAVITLIIVERALAAEERRARFRVSRHARDFLCSFLAYLVVMAYMRIIEGDISKFPPLCGSRLSKLYWFGGKIGAVDEMQSLVQDISDFNSVAFIGGLKAPNEEKLTEFVTRLDTYIQDTAVVRRDLSMMINKLTEAFDDHNRELFDKLYRLHIEHESEFVRPHTTASEAIMLFCSIAMFFRHIEPIYSTLERMKSQIRINADEAGAYYVEL
jgi:hypothetical protein